MRIVGSLCALAMAGMVLAQVAPLPEPTATAKGTVFEDANGNGVRDPGERGLGGVAVSNGLDVVRTDRAGRWSLPAWDDAAFFVVKPSGWTTPVRPDGRPLFHYVHKPAGSPQLRFAGVAPTGPLPESIDFPLRRRSEPRSFEVLLFGDTQPRNLREVDYLARDVVAPIAPQAGRFAFGAVLGDIVFDGLDVTEPLVRTLGTLGLSWRYVIGNHDLNFDAPDDLLSDEHFERVFGPAYYSFDVGGVHFVVLDDVEWIGTENAKRENPERARGYYRAALGPRQLKWLENDLRLVPKDRTVVVMMHIPLNEVRERADVLRLLSPFPSNVSFSAHTHTMEHRFFGREDGWQGEGRHHHIVHGTSCGSWWGGLPDERGVPHATMSDGTPNGYGVLRVDGGRWSWEFVAVGPASEGAMRILAPDALSASEVRGTEVLANVFGASELSRVEISVSGGPWRAMRRVERPDPWYVQLVERDKAQVKLPYLPLPGPSRCTHLWSTVLAERLEPGVHALRVRETDLWGRTREGLRTIRVE
ncbi:MAG: calcineurin-like phosphoesterase C-terminal domain-containing protein [Fimbriimonadaceae bacterium]